MNELTEAVEQAYLRAEHHLGRVFVRPHVRLDLRGQRAGVAYLGRNLLRFNERMLQDNREDFLRQTVPHEVAHLVAHALYGGNIRPHGYQWQKLMVEVFGLEPRRCHDYAVPERRRTHYYYQCGCPAPISFTPQRHAWAGRGRRYQCRRCGDLLKFTGKLQFA
ncbi:SprT-like domain-containing protein [Pseudomonas saliphila]|uniref:SprT-like domain-containing protein n=1 Tax=Pseudomonas saliphila TaxID=2586906 RepID=UPI001238BA33|nr:SprT-like domain-containing protein [Pseudomonas saliphila]